MDSGTDERRREALLRRLTTLGFSPREVAGGEGFVVTLPVGREPFALPDGRGLALADVALVTIGDDCMKCITPRVLFALPPLRWIDCNGAAALEARLRECWQTHLDTVAASKRWLAKLCIDAADDPGAPLVSFPLGLGDDRVRAFALAPGRVALPSCGPLAGVTLSRSEDRVFDVVSSLASGVDLQIAVTTRMEELARLDARLARENARDARVAASAAATTATNAANTLRRTDPDDLRRILLVGARLVGETALHESLRLRGLDVVLARSANEALHVFDTRSPEFVLTEARLDRFEGIELIHALRALPGIEDVPVALLDDRARPELREAAAAPARAATSFARSICRASPPRWPSSCDGRGGDASRAILARQRAGGVERRDGYDVRSAAAGCCVERRRDSDRGLDRWMIRSPCAG